MPFLVPHPLQRQTMSLGNSKAPLSCTISCPVFPASLPPCAGLVGVCFSVSHMLVGKPSSGTLRHLIQLTVLGSQDLFQSLLGTL